MPADFNWPKPWLLELYRQAVEQGCIRIVLRGQTAEDREAEWKSFKASFLRLRRKKDANFVVQMRPEYSLVSLRYEPELGKVLISYSSLPDGELLPTVEAVDNQRPIQQPQGSLPHDTPEAAPEDFDPTAHVQKLLGNINLDEEDEASEL